MSSPAASTGPKRPRRWLAFSLRALLAFTLVACVTAAYFGNLWRDVQKRRATLAELNALGFSHQDNFNPEIEELKQPPGPWIGRALIGDDAYATVTGMQSSESKPYSIDDLKLLADLPEVQYVRLSRKWATDGAIDHLAKVRGLKGVDLYDTSITPAGFERLAKVRGLESLTLIGPNINDETFAHFHELPNLSRLEFQTSTITSVGMASIGKIASLREASFKNVQGIDAEGLKHFSQLRQLDELVLVKIDLDAAALAEIGRIKSLKTVRFQECGMTDEAAQKLAGLSDLEYLSLQEMPLGDGCIDAILSLHKLEYICLSDAQLT